MGMPDNSKNKPVSLKKKAGLIKGGIKVLRMASIGRIISIIVHEINNPMQAIQGGSALGLEELDDPQAVKTYFELIQRESARVLKLTGILRSVYSPDQTDVEDQSMNAIVDEVMVLVKEDIKVKGINFHLFTEDDLPLVNIPRHQVFVILLNLFLNLDDVIFSTGHKNLDFTVSSHERMIMLEFKTDFPLVTDLDAAAATQQDFVELSLVERIVSSYGGAIELTHQLANSLLKVEIPFKHEGTQSS